MKRKHLLKKIFAAALVITSLVALSAVVYGNTTSSDPLVTLSYLTGTYKTGILSEVNQSITAEKRTVSSTFSSQVAGLKSAVKSTSSKPVETDYKTVTLSDGQTLDVSTGGEVLFLTGAAKVTITGMTDATAGSSLAVGTALTENHLYIASGDSQIQASGSVTLLVK